MKPKRKRTPHDIGWLVTRVVLGVIMGWCGGGRANGGVQTLD